MNVSEVQKLVESTVYPVMVEKYKTVPTMYDRLCKVVPYDVTQAYGTKGSVIGGFGQLKERSDGEAPKADRLFDAYTWQCAVKILSSSVTLERRLLESSNALGKIGDMISRVSENWGVSAQRAKDAKLSLMFQKGTLTAGHEVFDNSYEGNIQSNRLFVYDGLPWFDGAHTISGGSNTYSNIATGTTLSAANVETMLGTMRVTNAVDERGQAINIEPNCIVVPPGAEEYKARRIFNSTLRPESANNDINVLQGLIEVIPWVSIADDTDCGYIGTKGEGLIAIDSGVPEIRVQQLTDGTGNVIVSCDAYFGIAVTDAFRYWYSYGRADS